MTSSRGALWFGIAGLLALTVSAYWGVFQNDFVEIDDVIYVTQNQHTRAGLSKSGFFYAWTTYDSGNWIPLTWLSYQLDTTIQGFHARSYHATNLALHAANVLLIFALLNRLTGEGRLSWIVAALFAVHPLHVESVAWIAERKDVLSTFWLLVSLIAYERYCVGLTARWYLAAIAAFVLGLLSKSMVVTLPILMLVLDWWPLQRVIGSSRDTQTPHKYPQQTARWLLIEKVPLLALSLADGVVTIMAQDAGFVLGEQSAGSAISTMPWSYRLGNALVGYAWYFAKTVWPTRLCAFYPHPGTNLDLKQVLGAVVLLMLAVLYIALAGRRRPHLTFGGLWYFVSLTPVIGLLQVGTQAYADRYSYIPHIGLLFLIVWEGHFWLRQLPLAKFIQPAIVAPAIFALSWMTSLQVATWNSADTLWARVLDVDPDNWFAHLQLGNRRVQNGDLDQAAYRHLTIALERNSRHPYALNNMGWIHQNRGEWDDAARFYRRALAVKPSFTLAMQNLITIRKKQRRLEQDIELIDDYLRQRPNDAWTVNERGMIAVRLGQFEKAQAFFEQSLRADPDQRDARINLALCLSQLGKDQESKPHLQIVVDRYPDDANSRVNFGRVLERLGEFTAARQQYAEALRISPEDREASERLQFLEKQQP